MVQGNTVSAMGPYKGLKEIRRIIIDCMKNVHPIYHIKVSLTGQQCRKESILGSITHLCTKFWLI
jgi:ribosomal RNA assembly protein